MWTFLTIVSVIIIYAILSNTLTEYLDKPGRLWQAAKRKEELENQAEQERKQKDAWILEDRRTADREEFISNLEIYL